ncbi:protein of unknown function (plasmid) [Paraburkholderia dioscoreae]|uniref:Uncharacterized protein n=1 Tax=Paraburkholderia dioscoreae TaxID=2604047 RepID=A0A5Q4YWN4_9BURK|nr:protein of unknown function [Paraburkholderia dioscoreae]
MKGDGDQREHTTDKCLLVQRDASPLDKSKMDAQSRSDENATYERKRRNDYFNLFVHPVFLCLGQRNNAFQFRPAVDAHFSVRVCDPCPIWIRTQA